MVLGVVGFAVGAAPASAANPLPTLTALSWSLPNVNATSGAATNTLNWTVEYPGTHVPVDGSLTIGMRSATPDVFLPLRQAVSFNGNDVRQTSAVVSGNLTVTYSYTFALPPSAFTTHPTWGVFSIFANSGQFGELSLTAPDLAQSPYQPDFTSDSTLDLGPSVGSVTVAQPFVFESHLGANLGWQVVPATTQPAWIDAVSVDLTAPDGSTLSLSSPANTQPGHFVDQITSTFPPRLSVVLPASAPSGTYTVQRMVIADELGATTTVTAPPGGSFVVTRNETIGATRFQFVSNDVNDWSGPQTVDLTMHVTSQPQVNSVTVVFDNSGCVAGAPVLVADTDIVSVPVTMAEATPQCSVNGIKLGNTAGDVSAFGPAYDNPTILPVLSAISLPAATVTNITVDKKTIDYDTGGTVNVSMDVSSQAGVTEVEAFVSSDFAGSIRLGRLLSGHVIVPVTVKPHTPPGPLPLDVLVIEADNLEGNFQPPGIVVGPPGAGEFIPVSPSRLLDTRKTGGPVGAGGQVSIPVAGVNGVPADATAVVMNLTATAPTASTFLTAWPHGQVRPGTSNLNPVAGQTLANEVTAPIGANGKVDVFNHVGSVQVIADLLGYYEPTIAGL
ncbi:MAG TPA: hypothetical protein VFX16_24055, partial [Pseudonocardiaceae bacterium]|nr:hypothetical protein [Pseudonocardiaceae bacterium]